MWKITGTLLLTCCLQAAVAQDRNPEHRSILEEPIQFATKDTKDACYMSVMEQGDLTKLRILCMGKVRSYWCEYKGKPHVCRNYNSNPRHYFTQIMWDLRKLQNACQGQSVIKPLICRRASDEAQMVFTTSSSRDAVPKDRLSRPSFVRPVQKPYQSKQEQRPKPTKPQFQALRSQSIKTSEDKSNQVMTTPTPTVPGLTDPAPPSEAKKLAQDYCWQSFHGVCSYFIGWFKN